MPATVPPGHTRGPIMFMGPLTDELAFDRLMQSFWDEAGSYGARILIVAAASDDRTGADRYTRWLSEAEVEWVKTLPAGDRRTAREPANVELIDTATAILVTDGNPLRFAGMLGGTPAAQAIRRANARGRTVCGIGTGGAVLSQHMVLPGAAIERTARQLTPDQIRFAPGLGLVNRLTVLCSDDAGAKIRSHLPHLLTAVAYNPFLIGVALDHNTGIVVYANSTLEVFGSASAMIVDGWQVEDLTLYASQPQQPFQITGAELHTLGHGYVYNLDSHRADRPPESDIPQAGYEKFSSF